MTVPVKVTCEFSIKGKVLDAAINGKRNVHYYLGYERHDPDGFFGT